MPDYRGSSPRGQGRGGAGGAGIGSVNGVNRIVAWRSHPCRGSWGPRCGPSWNPGVFEPEEGGVFRGKILRTRRGLEPDAEVVRVITYDAFMDGPPTGESSPSAQEEGTGAKPVSDEAGFAPIETAAHAVHFLEDRCEQPVPVRFPFRELFQAHGGKPVAGVHPGGHGVHIDPHPHDHHHAGGAGDPLREEPRRFSGADAQVVGPLDRRFDSGHAPDRLRCGKGRAHGEQPGTGRKVVRQGEGEGQAAVRHGAPRAPSEALPRGLDLRREEYARAHAARSHPFGEALVGGVHRVRQEDLPEEVGLIQSGSQSTCVQSAHGAQGSCARFARSFPFHSTTVRGGGKGKVFDKMKKSLKCRTGLITSRQA